MGGKGSGRRSSKRDAGILAALRAIVLQREGKQIEATEKRASDAFRQRQRRRGGSK